MMKMKYTMLVTAIAAVIFTGCGGGGSSSDASTSGPVITINGFNPVHVLQNTSYTDANATSNGGETVTSTGTVISTATLGTYTVTYSATDSEGNTATAVRTVKVISPTASVGGNSYGVVISPYTGLGWLDRNLGAAQVCTLSTDTACYGDYYQWGRSADGHEASNSGLTSTASTTISTGHSLFITAFARYPADWLSYGVDVDLTQRQSNWAKTDGTSVCPAGFRVPTLTELLTETVDNGVTNDITAFASFLKIPSSGLRSASNGNLSTVSGFVNIWSNSKDATSISSPSYLSIDTSSAFGFSGDAASGKSVRCKKD